MRKRKPNELKESSLTVRFYPSEKTLIKEAAAADSRTYSEYIQLAAIRAAEADLAELNAA